MSTPPRRLGRGISSLISSQITAPDEPADAPPPVSPPPPVEPARRGPMLMSIPVDKVRANPMQPRRYFDESQIATLAASLRERGALQPIVVRPAEGGYELIAGERRLRASRVAGLTEIPAVVRPVRDEEMLELALIENIHRSELNPIERARAYRILQEQHGLSDETIATRMGEDRSTVNNYIRLLKLEPEVQGMIASGALSTGHGKVLLGCAETGRQLELARKATREGWSVRELERALKQGGGPVAAKAPREIRPIVRDVEQRLSQSLGRRVQIKESRKKNAGVISFEYYNLADFETIVAMLGVATAE